MCRGLALQLGACSNRKTFHVALDWDTSAPALVRAGMTWEVAGSLLLVDEQLFHEPKAHVHERKEDHDRENLRHFRAGNTLPDPTNR